jgi:hypothetical protein
MLSRNYCLLFAFMCLFVFTGANAAPDPVEPQEEEAAEDPLLELLAKTTSPGQHPLGDVRVEPPLTTAPDKK